MILAVLLASADQSQCLGIAGKLWLRHQWSLNSSTCFSSDSFNSSTSSLSSFWWLLQALKLRFWFSVWGLFWTVVNTLPMMQSVLPDRLKGDQTYSQDKRQKTHTHTHIYKSLIQKFQFKANQSEEILCHKFMLNLWKVSNWNAMGPICHRGLSVSSKLLSRSDKSSPWPHSFLCCILYNLKKYPFNSTL